MKAGLERMYGSDTPDAERDVMYYLTLYNETYPMPALPEDRAEEIAQGAVEGMYRFHDAPEGPSKRASILFSGPMWQAAVAARDELAERWDVAADLWSVTSYKKLREDALAAERHNRLHPSGDARAAMVTERLADTDGPVVAVSDNMCAVPDQVARWVGRPYTSLGTDGFGRSDTREALRSFFEVDAPHVVVAVLASLCAQGQVDASTVAEAIEAHGIDPELTPPWTR
jgi:pyruvate dehydrogenase E1 component